MIDVRLWRRRQDRIAELTREGEERLADAKATVERLEPKIEYQAERHRRNAVLDEATWVLTRGGTAH